MRIEQITEDTHTRYNEFYGETSSDISGQVYYNDSHVYYDGATFWYVDETFSLDGIYSGEYELMAEDIRENSRFYPKFLGLDIKMKLGSLIDNDHAQFVFDEASNSIYDGVCECSLILQIDKGVEQVSYLRAYGSGGNYRYTNNSSYTLTN